MFGLGLVEVDKPVYALLCCCCGAGDYGVCGSNLLLTGGKICWDARDGLGGIVLGMLFWEGRGIAQGWLRGGV